MIPVQEAPEPAHFRDVVGVPGEAFLRETPNPTSSQWKGRDYWTKVTGELRRSYGQLCAYSATWIPYTDGQSVDHFLPKSQRPDLAYTWSNYRYVFSYLNGCKGTSVDILDPFEIDPGWFIIQFPSLLILPAAGLTAALTVKVNETCKRLHLNDEMRCLADRRAYLTEYCAGRVSFEFLQRKAPFLAGELQRQDLTETIKVMMNRA